MDKDKLLKWIDENTEVADPEDCSINMVCTDDLRETIQNNEFDKEPCIYCESWEARNIQIKEIQRHYDYPKTYLYDYCPNCGRKLKGI